ncbi:MAG TPA: ATP-binding protein [Tepidisphaeraceae bacterium]|nr:ATP-binding protein [Tepidisphaeraceae bacterium]
MTNPVPTTLRRRLIKQIGLMVVGLLLLSATAIVGIDGLHQDFGEALTGYQQLRAVYEIGQNMSQARLALQANPQDIASSQSAIEAGILKFDTSRELQALVEQAAVLRASLNRAHTETNSSNIEMVLSHLANCSAHIRKRIVAAEQAANHQRELTRIVILTASALIITAGVLIGIQQYRGVMRPLARLSSAARRMAAGQFNEPIPTIGDREFVLLAQDFNRMANELETLYRDLARQVEQKSKQLVRSERLASVGYLAAGVAHEINNPLSIITGYGERALRQLDAEGRNSDNAHKAISIMCEEAFRCKKITDRLLSLARPGSESLVDVSLATLADEVICNVAAIVEYRNRRIVFENNSRHDLTIRARDGEIKQVILNLLLNALQAGAANQGEVRITLSHQNNQAEMTVADTGRGMDGPTLDRVFEPFYTHNRGSATPGMGLGLSITHAIVAEHHGTIEAHSDGLGKGSRFIVRWPLSGLGASHANR